MLLSLGVSDIDKQRCECLDALEEDYKAKVDALKCELSNLEKLIEECKSQNLNKMKDFFEKFSIDEQQKVQEKA